MIPRKLIRTVPEHTTDEVEEFWRHGCELHPDWDHVTLRDPLDPAGFPRTSRYWGLCGSGAQKAGLVRLEALWEMGGVYVDSDYEFYRPFDDLLDLGAFAGYEDEWIIPDAVIGAFRAHPVITACLVLAIQRLTGKAFRSHRDWRDDQGAWGTGPGVTTTIFGQSDDVTVLPREAFYAVHHLEARDATLNWTWVKQQHPDAYGVHHYHASWLSDVRR